MSTAEEDAIIAQLVRDRRETRRLFELADADLHAMLRSLEQLTHSLRERLLRDREEDIQVPLADLQRLAALLDDHKRLRALARELDRRLRMQTGE